MTAETDGDRPPLAAGADEMIGDAADIVGRELSRQGHQPIASGSCLVSPVRPRSSWKTFDGRESRS